MIASRFQGEGAWDAVINSFSMDIEEEQDFIEWLAGNGYEHPKLVVLEHLEMLYQEWRENR